MNFVFVSLQRINADRESTSTSLAKELSKKHRVLYVNPPIDRRTWFTGKTDKFTKKHIQLIKEKDNRLIRISDNLSVLNPDKIIESLNWIPSTYLFSICIWLNNKTFASCIQKAINELEFDSFILINDKDMFRSFYLKELLKPSLSVYLDRDYTLGFDYWKRHGTNLEPKLMRKSDLVVCNSSDFTNRALKYNLNSFYIKNGANLEVFNDSKVWKKPEELNAYQRPLIGYVGALNAMRIDIELIATIAAKRNDWDFVFIGCEDDVFKNSILHDISNITFIPKKHTNEIPAYVKHFDVCINPQLINEITIGNFPLKIIEYLALGKPVVATATNTMKEEFSELTYLANDAEGYVAAIERALAEDNHERHASRIALAKRYSWKSVSEIFMDSIIKVADGRNLVV